MANPKEPLAAKPILLPVRPLMGTKSEKSAYSHGCLPCCTNKEYSLLVFCAVTRVTDTMDTAPQRSGAGGDILRKMDKAMRQLAGHWRSVEPRLRKPTR